MAMRSRSGWPLGVRADVRRLQPRVLPDAHRRPARACRGASTPTHAGLGWTLWNLLSTLGAAMLRRRHRAVLRRCAARLARRSRAARRPVAGRHARVAAGRGLRRAQHPRGRFARAAVEPARPAAEVAAGAHWLPGTVFGGRETLITHPRRARPLHLLRPARRQLVAARRRASGTAGFFLLLTVKWMLPAFAFGLARHRRGGRLAVADRPAAADARRPRWRPASICRSARPARGRIRGGRR